MSRLGFTLLCICACAASCRMTDRSVVTRDVARAGKLTRAGGTPGLEIFPRVVTEPRPMASVILEQASISACLAGASGLADPNFVVELSGRLTESGKVVEPDVVGVDASVARCMAEALTGLIVPPGRAGYFRMTLSRRPDGAGAGLIIDPGPGKKFE